MTSHIYRQIKNKQLLHFDIRDALGSHSPETTEQSTARCIDEWHSQHHSAQLYTNVHSSLITTTVLQLAACRLLSSCLSACCAHCTATAAAATAMMQDGGRTTESHMQWVSPPIHCHCHSYSHSQSHYIQVRSLLPPRHPLAPLHVRNYATWAFGPFDWVSVATNHHGVAGHGCLVYSRDSTGTKRPSYGNADNQRQARS